MLKPIPSCWIACLLLLSPSLCGQKPAFEVASVKPNDSGALRSSSSSVPRGTMRATNVSLRFLVLWAYDLNGFQVAGGPSWIDMAKFDLEARAAPAIPDPDVHGMLRSLLEERFHLRVHRETRAMDVFLLAVTDGGSKLRSIPARRSGPPFSTRTNAGSAGGEIKASDVRIGLLADTLRSELGRPIIDRTNLTGVFEIDLTWSPSASGSLGGGPGGLDPVNEPARQAIFAALREQLGLKLEPARVPVEILVIDSAENPFKK